MIVDSNILIDYLRGRAEASDFLDGVPDLVVHAVSVAEVLEGVVSKADQRETVRLVGRFQVDYPMTADFDEAFSLLKQHRLSHGLGWADDVIAATCLRTEATIATLNDKHFRPVRGLKVVRPY